MDRLTLGYSPCPNDTFIFHAMTHGLIQTRGLSFAVVHEDVETLNQWAVQGQLDSTKLSFAALGRVLDRYALLKTGAALGNGCGPLIVGRPETDLPRLCQEPAVIAIPGEMTTAFLLLSLFMPDGAPYTWKPMPFDRIMPTVSAGDADLGLIIHESRFTYADHGLICLVDLGEWWEASTGKPIPLGGIVVRRDVDPEIARSLETLIGESIDYAWAHPEVSADYIRAHAQEMAPDVIRQHIGLYVNPFSRNLGDDGRAAVETLFAKAAERGLFPADLPPLFF
ncbi:MAG: 1,4-dihydroxy-6-naphthoate synthase [Deltaproteobacteria bacterium]|nr:MAG: 1,4-dihydroxy-6-naphthoate synthase [Deltaproteobacteria bacterium]